MAQIHQFPRYTGPENFVTNNTLFLLSRVYQIDRYLLEAFLNKVLDGGEISLGPSFGQQISTGGVGIPDGMIAQQSFRIVVETKLHDNNFWGKEEYTSHFQGETTRVLLTISKLPLQQHATDRFRKALDKYDTETSAKGSTLHNHLTFSSLIGQLREVVDQTRTRYKIELEELIDDYEGFIWQQGLIDDAFMRMHVFAVNDTEAENLQYLLYYNPASKNESPHKFIGLYRNKAVRHVGEVRTVVIPKRQEDGSLSFTFRKGKENFTSQMEQRLRDWIVDEGWGDDGRLKFHLFDSLYPTAFKKSTSGGIMGPRHFYLSDYIDNIQQDASAQSIATALEGQVW